jgi:tetratricopeptide (TPR) repeat protein
MLNEARELWKRAMTCARQVGDRVVEAVALGNLGVAAMYDGRYEPAAVLLEDALALVREMGARGPMCTSLATLAQVLAHIPGSEQRARTLIREAIVIAEELREPRPQLFAVLGAAAVECELGSAREALELFHGLVSDPGVHDSGLGSGIRRLADALVKRGVPPEELWRRA